MKKKTELVVMGGMLALSLASPYAAQAASVACSGALTAAQADVSVSAAGGYVLEAFKVNCSANVALQYDGNATAVGVKSASAKGMHSFGGSSNGGSVKQCEATSLAAPTASVSSVTISAGC